MANSKKTKALIAAEIVDLQPKLDELNTRVDDLERKLVHAQQYYDDAAAKRDELQDTIDKYKQDKDK